MRMKIFIASINFLCKPLLSTALVMMRMMMMMIMMTMMNLSNKLNIIMMIMKKS